MEIDTAVFVTMGGLGAGIGAGGLMTELADIKKGSAIAEVHHWVVGALISLTGIILAVVKKLKWSAPFLCAFGLGIALTDLRHMGKQIDNLRDNEPISTGILNPNENNGQWVNNNTQGYEMINWE